MCNLLKSTTNLYNTYCIYIPYIFQQEELEEVRKLRLEMKFVAQPIKKGKPLKRRHRRTPTNPEAPMLATGKVTGRRTRFLSNGDEVPIPGSPSSRSPVTSSGARLRQRCFSDDYTATKPQAPKLSTSRRKRLLSDGDEWVSRLPTKNKRFGRRILAE